MLVLAGDIGATNTRLAIAEIKENELKVLAQQNYKGIEYPNLTTIIRAFLDTSGDSSRVFHSLCLAVAGPIEQDMVKVTNLPWTISKSELSEDLKIEKVALINDFQAVGYGVDTLLPGKDLYTLQHGKPVCHGVRTLMGAGTGLGVGFMFWDGKQYIVSPSEGGHINFGPNDDVQAGLLYYLRRKYHRVSCERLLSGKGIQNIYSYFRDQEIDEENAELRVAMHRGDPSALISEYAIKYKDPIAMRAIDTFVRIYGSMAGDLGYMFLPHGGLYIAGGIAPKLLDQFTDGRFMSAYCDKGRLFKILQELPVHIVLNNETGLRGAAVFASRL